jgi:hypothetical protein
MTPLARLGPSSSIGLLEAGDAGKGEGRAELGLSLSTVGVGTRDKSGLPDGVVVPSLGKLAARVVEPLLSGDRAPALPPRMPFSRLVRRRRAFSEATLTMLVARSLPFREAGTSGSDAVPAPVLAPASARCWREYASGSDMADIEEPGRSLTWDHTRMACTISLYPLISARSSGVIPFLSGLSATAPHPRRIWTTVLCPLAAAKWRGVEPTVPTAGALLPRLPFSE